MTNNELIRLTKSVIKTETCWLWNGAKRAGYGIAWFHGRCRSVHKLFYNHFNNIQIETGNYLHKCNVKNCVNPEHVYVGNQKTNSLDALRDGLMSNVKLNELKVV